MTQAAAPPPDPADVITPGNYRFLTIWTIALLLVYVLSGVLGVRQMLRYRAETRRMREAVAALPSGRIPFLPAAAPGAHPVDVHVGFELDRISEVDPKEGGWTADFHLWFHWSGATVDPGRNFQVANGKILDRERVRSRVVDGVHEELWRVTARMMKSFDVARVPIGDESIRIEILDTMDSADSLRYVTDAQSVHAGGVAAPQSMNIRQVKPLVWIRDVLSERGTEEPHSLFAVAMLTQSPVANRYLRIFQALFASVAICLIVFFIKPVHVDPRFGLPVGAFFAAVGNNIAVASSMPDSARLTLVQMVNAIGLGTIFLTLVQSAISLWLFDTMGRERFSRMFDRASFVVIGIAYVVINFALPLAAR